MIISTCLIVIYLSYYFFQVYRKKFVVDKMKAKMVGMVLGMVNSILIGLLIGFMLQGHLAVSTIYSVLIGFIIGILICKPFGAAAITDALSSGMMGAMMGAMLGEMLSKGDLTLMLLFFNTIYILTMSLMMLWLELKIFSHKQSYAFLLSAVIPILIVLSITYLNLDGGNKQTKMQDSPQHHEMQMKQ